MDLKSFHGMLSLGNRDKRVSINHSILQAKPDIICLQETKIQSMSVSIIKDVWSLTSKSWVALPSWGASGGILVLWNEDNIEVLD